MNTKRCFQNGNFFVSAAYTMYACFLFTVPFNALANSLDFYMNIDADLSQVSGGLKDGFASRVKADTGFEADLSSWLGDGSVFVATYSMLRGDNGSDFAGDIQAFSNIDEREYSRLLESYLSLNLSSKSRLKLGLMDATTDFAAPQYGGNFIHASMGFSPTILGISTYPEPTFGAYIDYRFSDLLTLKAGHFAAGESRTSFNNHFSIVEAAVEYQAGSQIRIGYWRNSDVAFQDNDAELFDAIDDFYVTIDHHISKKWSGFIQLGSVAPQVSEITNHKSIGINYEGLWFDDDALGLQVSDVSVTGLDNETAYELYYEYPANEKVSIKPTVHYIDTPSGDKNLSNVFIVGVRVTIIL